MTRLTASMSRGSGRMTGLQATRRRVQARSFPLPAPTGGLDSISPIQNMPPDHALVLDNWFPQPGYVEVRRGHVLQCNTATGAPVETVMGYQAPNPANDKLFCATGGKVVNVTTSTPSNAITGLTSSRWQHVNFATSGGNFLWMCNGADAPRYFDGSSWATPTITGITAADIINVNVFRNRLWFCLKNSLDAAYLRVDSIQGAAFKFTLGGVFQEGGYLQAIATWSLDGGDGPDDHIAFISSRGEVAVYSGSDPTNAASFNLVGVYTIGSPIGRRCFTKMGGDVALISVDGLLPLSKALVSDRAAVLKSAFTAIIQPTINEQALNFSDNFGWQVLAYPLGTRAILNVPQLENETQVQYVMNTVTGAWCRFLGMNAACWELWQDRLYFGGNDGCVYLADTGSSDNGAAIDADSIGAFNGLDNPAILKQFVMARPFLTSDGDVVPAIALNVDYNTDATLETATSTIQVQAQWDQAQWDVDSWPIETRAVNDWSVTPADIGNVVSIRTQVSALGAGGTGDITLRLNATQILYIPSEGYI